MGSQSLCSGLSHWQLEQSWTHLLFSQCSLSCRCCLWSWLRDFGTGTSENTSGYLHHHQDTGGSSSCVHSAVLPRLLAYLSGSQTAICRYAFIQHWTSGTFHAVTLTAPSAQSSFKVLRLAGSNENRKKVEHPSPPSPPIYLFSVLFFFFSCLVLVRAWPALQLALNGKGGRAAGMGEDRIQFQRNWEETV